MQRPILWLVASALALAALVGAAPRAARSCPRWAPSYGAWPPSGDYIPVDAQVVLTSYGFERPRAPVAQLRTAYGVVPLRVLERAAWSRPQWLVAPAFELRPGIEVQLEIANGADVAVVARYRTLPSFAAPAPRPLRWRVAPEVTRPLVADDGAWAGAAIRAEAATRDRVLLEVRMRSGGPVGGVFAWLEGDPASMPTSWWLTEPGKTLGVRDAVYPRSFAPDTSYELAVALRDARGVRTPEASVWLETPSDDARFVPPPLPQPDEEANGRLAAQRTGEPPGSHELATLADVDDYTYEMGALGDPARLALDATFEREALWSATGALAIGLLAVGAVAARTARLRRLARRVSSPPSR